MNERKELLTEENYERAKKKVMRLALIVLVIGFLIGGCLIATGIIKAREVEKSNEQAIQQIEQSSKARTAEQVQADINTVQEQIDTLNSEISNLRNEQQKIFMEDTGYSDRYYAKKTEIENKQNELSKLRTQLSDYKTELWKIESGYNDTSKKIAIAHNTKDTFVSQVLYMVGGFIIIATCMISLFIYIFGKRREIAAFTTQQVMPVAQEGIEKIAPSVGTAAGEIAKGIKNGLNDDKE